MKREIKIINEVMQEHSIEITAFVEEEKFFFS